MARRGLRYALVLSSASLLLAGGHWLLGTQMQETPAHGVTASESAWRADEPDVQTLTTGSTGASTGRHLHLEVIVDGMHVDPLTFLQRYADGRDVEITSRPELPWVPAVEPGGQGSGAGWDPGQTVTDAPATPSTPGGDAGVVTPAPSPSKDPDPATESSETPPSTTEPVAPDPGETDGGGSEAPPPEDVVPEMPQSTPESAPDASVTATSSE